MPRADWSQLTRFLDRIAHDEVTLEWDELTEIVGPMPASAVRHSAWWHGDRPQTGAWRAAGFEVVAREPGRRVTFRRIDGGTGERRLAAGRAEVGQIPRTAIRSWTPVQRRREEAIAALIADFPAHVAHFEASEAFPGPSVYFHLKAIERRRTHDTVAGLLADNRFLEYVYAVLPAWGMHRMGQQSRAKVRDFDAIVAALRANVARLTELWPLRITQLSSADAAEAAEIAWEVIAETRVSTSRTQIVAGSKTLHHLLPDLIPPIDRQYTFRFFTGQKAVPSGDRAAFVEWLPMFAEIGTACRESIRSAIVRDGFMATGEAKIIDNAIMGYMQQRGGQAPASESL